MRGIRRIALFAVVAVAFGFLPHTGGAALHDDPGHRSSLKAILSVSDGTTRSVVVAGVGCTEAMCSRVRLLDENAHPVWLDDVRALDQISRDGQGVTTLVTFRDGATRRVSIKESNRILYLARPLGFTEPLDFAGIRRIEFE